MIEQIVTEIAPTRPRRKVPPIKVWVSDAEKALIAESAMQAGLSRSSYLLTAGLNQPIRSRVDLLAVGDLAKVNGDLGRVAGLLKFWLKEKRGQGVRSHDVEAIMNDFRTLQNTMLAVMSRIVR